MFAGKIFCLAFKQNPQQKGKRNELLAGKKGETQTEKQMLISDLEVALFCIRPIS